MANMCPYGRFTHAVVRGIPQSPSVGGVEVEVAKLQRQYGVLVGTLRQKVGLQVLEIPADTHTNTNLPESWRIEDMAIIQGDTALLTQPLSQERRQEVEAVRRVLTELNLTMVEMEDDGATLEGSDVLFTGREFFVGLSKHTNQRGAEILANTFRDFAVSTVPVSAGTRLKNICSMGGPETIIFSNSEGARRTLRVMEQLTDHHYDVLCVPEDAAANCVYVRSAGEVDYLLHPTQEECPNSVSAFQKFTGYNLLPTSCSEASRLGGSLTSFCLLINKKLPF
ncbi:N(G),N(G)-dimethylarginine dimethylaminohydrolase 2 isoform X1 [Tachysurus fulvidraco]|uniref:N(G),N(G)-dimethylarginine dimethylaminohydrolase 2 isoform X1 n=1 Tax=Tachysurus fulvidraco TaxID=1234273 RepID=UPI001FEFA597|nr:N(G),N(G)-dimethylarginine dimethylaminohydrolase 2 isoform X1 [Tachysurus fulvidraco]XP_047675162.1 N(G),N(G)-dimethylarginine dimethylaminohydrolase 2 isoform X1 [Tachysurus fulvidraco]